MLTRPYKSAKFLTLGWSRAVVVSRPREIWRSGVKHEYYLRVTEPGLTYRVRPDAKITMPTQVNAVQKVQDGFVSNNRDCHITEIGLKSTVWKQITSFPNVNSQPERDVIEDYESEGDQIQLGQMSKYINRYSFFIVKARRQGTERWINICDDKLLCIKGNTPQAKYNSIRIHHGFGQHEFKFEPKSGAYAMGRLGEDAYVLRVHEQEYRFSEGEYDMFFNAARVRLGVETLSNPEWIIGEAPVANGEIDWIQDSVGSDGGSKTEWGNRKTEYYVRLQNRSGTEYYAMTEPVGREPNKKNAHQGCLEERSRLFKRIKGQA